MFDIDSKWALKKNRRQFFNELAKDLGFSIFDPDAWYSVAVMDVLMKKASYQLLYSKINFAVVCTGW
jgi:hypothetical protein